MKDLLRRILEREFRDLSGLVISGSLPLRESLLNDLIADALNGLRERSAEPSASGGSPNLATFAALVKTARVRIDSDGVTLDFELRA